MPFTFFEHSSQFITYRSSFFRRFLIYTGEIAFLNKLNAREMEMEVRGRPGVCQRTVVHQIAIVMFIWLAELRL